MNVLILVLFILMLLVPCVIALRVRRLEDEDDVESLAPVAALDGSGVPMEAPAAGYTADFVHEPFQAVLMAEAALGAPAMPPFVPGALVPGALAAQDLLLMLEKALADERHAMAVARLANAGATEARARVSVIRAELAAEQARRLVGQAEEATYDAQIDYEELLDAEGIDGAGGEIVGDAGEIRLLKASRAA